MKTLGDFLRLVADFRRNYDAYCAYFYVLEYLVRFKGMIDLRDELEWVTEYLLDFFREYGVREIGKEMSYAFEEMFISGDPECLVNTYEDRERVCNPKCYAKIRTQIREEFVQKDFAEGLIRPVGLFWGEESMVEGCNKEELRALVMEGVKFWDKIFPCIHDPKLGLTAKKVLEHWFGISTIRLDIYLEHAFRSYVTWGEIECMEKLEEWFGVTCYELSLLHEIPPPPSEDMILRHKISLLVSASCLTKLILELTELNEQDYIRACAEIFRNGNWAEYFGGEKWAFIALTVADTYSAFADKTHLVDVFWHIQHNTNIWLNSVLIKEEIERLKKVLDAKFKGELDKIVPIASRLNPEISRFTDLLALEDADKPVWRAKEKALAERVKIGLETGL